MSVPTNLQRVKPFKNHFRLQEQYASYCIEAKPYMVPAHHPPIVLAHSYPVMISNIVEVQKRAGSRTDLSLCSGVLDICRDHLRQLRQELKVYRTWRRRRRTPPGVQGSRNGLGHILHPWRGAHPATLHALYTLPS